jgi:predicted alpha/beta hydrolase family esterase
MSVTVLLVPGLYDSGPRHWQRIWAHARGFQCIEQRDLQTPVRAEWVDTVERAVAAASGPLVLAGHSLGCATIAFWAATTAHAERVRGALLVAPSDTEAPSYPAGTSGFAPLPRARLPFASRVVLSSNDIYVRPEVARALAAAWGSEVTDIGNAGHINTDSGHGPWPEGLRLLEPWLGEI